MAHQCTVVGFTTALIVTKFKYIQDGETATTKQDYYITLDNLSGFKQNIECLLLQKPSQSPTLCN